MIEIDEQYSPSVDVTISQSGVNGKKIGLPLTFDESDDPLPEVGSKVKLRKDKKAGIVFFRYKPQVEVI